ncbi:MAG: hypothetical protein WDM89_01670 [Rhizomicrobium sp.]
MSAWPTCRAILASGKSIQHKITAAEGLTSQMIFGIVKNDPVLLGDTGTRCRTRARCCRDLSVHAWAQRAQRLSPRLRKAQ